MRVAVVNTKGGAGKSTVALNLAARMSQDGRKVVLVDCDPQESAIRCLERRDPSCPAIGSWAAKGIDVRVTRLYRLVDERTTDALIVDTPGAISNELLPYYYRDAHKILIPVQPSQIDIDACARLVGRLYTHGGIRSKDRRLGVVPNRVRADSAAFGRLLRFLAVLEIPVVASLRDLQTYQRCLERGIGITEALPPAPASEIEAWDTIVSWLYDAGDNTGGTPATEQAAPRPVTHDE